MATRDLTKDERALIDGALDAVAKSHQRAMNTAKVPGIIEAHAQEKANVEDLQAFLIRAQKVTCS